MYGLGRFGLLEDGESGIIFIFLVGICWSDEGGVSAVGLFNKRSYVSLEKSYSEGSPVCSEDEKEDKDPLRGTKEKD